MTEADTDWSLQLVLDQGHGTPIWRAAMLTKQPCSATDGPDKLRAEFELWKERWHAVAEPPKTALDAYTACNTSLYPNLSIPLLILVTLPVTPERSFSTLKWLRSSMGDERLTSLALIHVHAQTTSIEPVEVVDKFTHNKLNFLRYRLSCFCRVVYFFILKFLLVMSCEFSIMALALAPPLLDPAGGLPSHKPLFHIPFMKILDPPLNRIMQTFCIFLFCVIFVKLLYFIQC